MNFRSGAEYGGHNSRPLLAYLNEFYIN